MLGERTPQVNGQDQIVQSGNYCYSFIRLVSIDEIKNKAIEISPWLLLKLYVQTGLPFAQVKKEVCSADAGALASVFEKPATVKPKQKLPKCKSTIHIVIFNVRTLNGIGKQTELIASVVLFTNPSARAGYDTRSIFKRSLTGLNSEFSFS